MNLNNVVISNKFFTEADLRSNDERCLYLLLLQCADRCGLLKVVPSEVWLRWRPDRFADQVMDQSEVKRIVSEHIEEFQRRGFMRILVSGPSQLIVLKNYLKYQNMRVISLYTAIPAELLGPALTYSGIYSCADSALKSAQARGDARPLQGQMLRVCRAQLQKPMVALFPMPALDGVGFESTDDPFSTQETVGEPVKRGRGRPKKSDAAVEVSRKAVVNKGIVFPEIPPTQSALELVNEGGDGA